MKKAIVTGGAGFIGSNLVDKLIKDSGGDVEFELGNLSITIHGLNTFEKELI